MPVFKEETLFTEQPQSSSMKPARPEHCGRISRDSGKEPDITSQVGDSSHLFGLRAHQVNSQMSGTKLWGQSNLPIQDKATEEWPLMFKDDTRRPALGKPQYPTTPSPTITNNEELEWRSWLNDRIGGAGIVGYVYNLENKIIPYTLPCDCPLVDGKNKIMLRGSFNCFIFDDGIIRCIFTDEETFRKVAFGTFTLEADENVLRPWTLAEVLGIWNECNTWINLSILETEQFRKIYFFLRSVVQREETRLRGGYHCSAPTFPFELRYLDLHRRRTEPIFYFLTPNPKYPKLRLPVTARINGLRYESRRRSLSLFITYRMGDRIVQDHILDQPHLWIFKRDWDLGPDLSWPERSDGH